MDAGNLEWMYDGTSSKIHEEDYLLGKKITKLVEENETFMDRANASAGDMQILEKLDYDNKVREDPLFAIKQNELEHRKEVLSNPVKKKKIQSLLKTALEKDLAGKSKHKKKKKRRKHSSDSDDIEEEVFKKSMKDKNLRKILKEKLKNDLQKEDTSDTSEEESSGKKRRRSSEHHHSTSYKHRSSSDDESERRKTIQYGLTNVKSKSMTKEERRRARERRQKMPSPKREDVSYKRKHAQGFTKKLSKDELERKRREMMQSADVRNTERRRNVDQYTREEQEDMKREEHVRKMHRKHEDDFGVKGKDFVHAIKMQNVSSGSLQDTIRRKKHKLSGKV